jgi:cytochrome c-type biogenesis protein
MEFTLSIAFLAGLVSFLSPCVLPIIPGFLAYLAGTKLEESKNHRLEMFLNSLAFVLGFAIIFAALGVLLNTVLEAVAYDVQAWLSRIGGLIIIFFGLLLTGLIKIDFLQREHKFRVRKFKSRYFTSALFGAAFAAGWSPCVGAVLGAVLALSATAPVSAFTLLMTYSIGLGIPFLVIGLFAAPAAKFINKYAGVAKYINITFGIILIALGILIFTQNINLIANFSFVNKLVL